MRREEALVVEHREILELYKHYSTTIAYIFVSYMILNGVLTSFLGVLLSIKQLTFVLQILVWIAFSVAIIGNVIFTVFAKRLFDLVLFLANRGIEIEDALRDEMLTLDTFKKCVAYALKLHFLKGVYVIALLFVLTWIIAFIIVIMYG